MLAALFSLFGVLFASGGLAGKFATLDATAPQGNTDDTEDDEVISSSADDDGSGTGGTTDDTDADTQTGGTDTSGGSTPDDPPADPPAEDPILAPAAPPVGSHVSTGGPQTLEAQVFEAGAPIEVAGGRVTTLELETDEDTTIQAIEIVDGPAHGNATVNPDNTIALVMSGTDYTGDQSLTYKVTYDDGTTELQTLDMSVGALTQEAGWGTGSHYMLEEDDNGDIIVETGDNHRKVYISESDEALTREAIAALEGLDPADITTDWLIANPEYGGSEGMALKSSVGAEVWAEITGGRFPEPNSHWLLLERGYEYDSEAVGRVVQESAHGESELHPMHITAWGEGARPEITTGVTIYQSSSENIVITDVAMTNIVNNLMADNFLLSDVSISGKGLSVQNVSGLTLHDSEVSHVVLPTPEEEYWGNGRVQGIFANNVDNILIEGSIIHHNGWAEDYHMDSSTEGGMPPSVFSHNIYLQNTTTDVTVRDNIISQGSSFGLHLRGGGFVEDNAFIDNNMDIDILGGIYKSDGPIGNYTLFTDNVMTSAGYKLVDKYSMGAISAGYENLAYDTTTLDNMVVHLADPNNPEEIAFKTYAHYSIQNGQDPVYDDTVVYNWVGSVDGVDEEQNTEGLDPAVMDATTIQNYAAAIMGQEATITEFMDYLLSLTETEFDDLLAADDIIAYFQNGFGIEGNGDEAQTDHRFIPNNLADGIRWDNRLNWDTEDVPDDGDNVALAGNWVQYAGTTTIGDLAMGGGGKLSVNSGRLTVDGDLTTGDGGGEISTHSAGQFWTEGYDDADDRLTVLVEGGRFANTGTFTGKTSILASDGQTLLAVDDASLVLNAGSELRVDGAADRVGFDGETNGIAVLQMSDEAVLSFTADAEGFTAIEEFRSGKFDQDGSDVQSGVSLDGLLQIDVSGYTGDETEHTLIEVDALTGLMDDLHIHGLGAGQDANLVIDYTADKLLLEISAGGTGAVTFETVGDAADGSDETSALWLALTSGQGTFDDTAPILSAEEDELPDLLAG